jgi:hypothetical protein
MAINQSLELAKQELTQQKGGNELASALATGPLKLAAIEDIKGVLRYAMVKVGLRAANFPADIEKSILIDHIITHYGNHTVDEIRLAFDMAIAGKLDLKDEQVVCYENFSCLYFSTIMNAYREWAKEEYRHVKKEVPMIEQKEDLSDQAMQDWLDDTKKRKLSVEFMPVMLYDWLHKKGEIKLSNDKKFEYLGKATSYRLSKLQQAYEERPTEENRALYKEFQRMKEAGAIEGKEIDLIKNLAKKMILYDYCYA